MALRLTEYDPERKNGFGFVKFKEVKGVESLCSRLEDVWLGSYKLRINLARFGRNSSKNPSSKGIGKGAPEGVSASTSAGLLAQPEKSFRSALARPPLVTVQVPATTVVGEETNSIPILDTEVDEEFLQTLSGSYVGRLKKGVEARALQMKLCMAGMQAVKVAEMGGSLVLFSREGNADVGAPVNNILW
ncbi:endonuclease/exonuclease/phosphatase family protein, partial [Trifolium medium]|nr:endonuclease/exonuclease/phosphatase family protein [Trifolium medium]